MNHSENENVSGVVIKTRLQLAANLGEKITQERFAELVVEGMVNVSISRRSIIAWEKGQYEPDTNFLLTLFTRYHDTNDWRRTFAVNVLKAKLPEVFDSGVIELPITQ